MDGCLFKCPFIPTFIYFITLQFSLSWQIYFMYQRLIIIFSFFLKCQLKWNKQQQKEEMRLTDEHTEFNANISLSLSWCLKLHLLEQLLEREKKTEEKNTLTPVNTFQSHSLSNRPLNMYGICIIFVLCYINHHSFIICPLSNGSDWIHLATVMVINHSFNSLIHWFIRYPCLGAISTDMQKPIRCGYFSSSFQCIIHVYFLFLSLNEHWPFLAGSTWIFSLVFIFRQRRKKKQAGQQLMANGSMAGYILSTSEKNLV